MIQILFILILIVLIDFQIQKEVYWQGEEPDNMLLNFGLEKNWKNPMRLRKLHEEEQFDMENQVFMQGLEAKSKQNFADIYSKSMDNFNSMNDLAFYIKQLQASDNGFQNSFNPSAPNYNQLTKNNIQQQKDNSASRRQSQQRFLQIEKKRLNNDINNNNLTGDNKYIINEDNKNENVYPSSSLISQFQSSNSQDNKDELYSTIKYLEERNNDMNSEPPNNNLDSSYQLSQQAFETELGEGFIKNYQENK